MKSATKQQVGKSPSKQLTLVIEKYNQGYKKTYNQVVNQVKNSNALHSCIQIPNDNEKDQAKINELIRNRIIKNHLQTSKTIHPYNKSSSMPKENELKRSTTANTSSFTSKPTLDSLLVVHGPKILNSLAFTRSEKPMNKIFIKNKYAQLF